MGKFGRSRDITVNIVAPGVVRTDMIEGEAEESVAGKEAMNRLSSEPVAPTDIADVVLMLASEKSRWITGQFIDVSGGVTGAV